MTEMEKLDRYLTLKKIPHTFKRRFPNLDRDEESKTIPPHDWGVQIVVYDSSKNRLWDAIWGIGTYGAEKGLLEVMGGDVVFPEDEDDVLGLTAMDVIKRLNRGKK